MERLLLDLRAINNAILGEGVYAKVFRVDDIAYKLFKKGVEIEPRQTLEGRQQVFELQCKAYEIAGADAFLQHHIAKYFGPREVQAVIDRDGIDVSAEFLLDCCYAMEVLSSPGWEHPPPQELDYIEDARARFRALGIDTYDASVFRWDSPSNFKFVDFELPFQRNEAAYDVNRAWASGYG